jgi:hypothetical protein
MLSASSLADLKKQASNRTGVKSPSRKRFSHDLLSAVSEDLLCGVVEQHDPLFFVHGNDRVHG